MLSAFINGKDIKTGTVISVVAKSVAPGETLALEYPNKSRVSGKVISASHSELELEINSEAWRLRPHAPSDSTIHNDLSDKDASFWTPGSALATVCTSSPQDAGAEDRLQGETIERC